MSYLRCRAAVPLLTLLAMLAPKCPAQVVTTPAPAAPPAAYTIDRNLPYNKYPQTVLDILQPASPASGKRPGVVMFHGGGWIRSSKETMMRSFCLPYLQQGYVVCNVEYRLAPVAPAPAAVNDALDAAAWFFRNAGKYNVELLRPDRHGASGPREAGSAGYLCAEGSGADVHRPGRGEYNRAGDAGYTAASAEAVFLGVRAG